MLYIIYLPKSKGDAINERKLNRLLKWYADLTREKYSIIAAPGYLSKTRNSIGLFLRELSNLLTNGYKRKIGFLNGMNGHYIITGGSSAIIDEHNSQLSLYNFDQIKISPKKEYDHRKMMCFFDRRSTTDLEITLDNLEKFLEDIYVGAILIGSSNQSKTTYFDTFATKGEADIFILDATEDSKVQDFFDKALLKHQSDNFDLSLFDDIVITKSFYGKGHANTQEFLKDILRDVLENGLEQEL